MSQRDKKKRGYYFEYLLLRAVQLKLGVMPRWLALKLGGCAGLILYYFGVYRKTVRGNMEYVGWWDKKQREQITKKLYYNIGQYATDFLRPSSVLPPHTISNIEIAQQHIQQGKGTIVLLAHLGNWEMLAEIFGRRFQDLNVIAKPMKNWFVDSWLAEKRKKTGVRTIYTHQALRKMLEVIKRNGLVAILIDQHAGKHGTMVPFLGKMANTVRTVAGIVHKTNCSVISSSALIQKNGSYTIDIQCVPSAVTAGKTDEECIAEYQRIHNDMISEWIKKNPEHWFGWFHKRFRGIIGYK